jgi:hypothetical protein
MMMVSQGYVLLSHVMFKGQRGHMIGQVTKSPDISQGHVLEGLRLDYSQGLGEVSWDLFVSLLVSEMVQAAPTTVSPL